MKITTSNRELLYRLDENPIYAEKKFIPQHGMLMEVTCEEYAAFYKEINHQLYSNKTTMLVKSVTNAVGTCTYTYDAWGKTISITDANGNAAPQNSIGNINPIRYRSYYFDAETNISYIFLAAFTSAFSEAKKTIKKS